MTRTSRWGSWDASRAMVTAAALLAIPYVLDAQGVPPTPPLARLEEELLLDAATHDFPAVTQVWVGPRGQVVVPIRQDLQLRLFDPSGAPLARVGRSGEGPGEFRSLGQVAWKGDTMLVVDSRLRRITYLAPDGRLLRAERYWTPDREASRAAAAAAQARPESRIFSFYPMGELADGTQLGTSNLERAAGAPRSAFGENVFVRVTPAGAPTVLFRLPGGDARWSIELDGFGIFVPFAIAPDYQIAPRGDRLVHLWGEAASRTGGTFTVTALRTDGDTLWVRTYPYVSPLVPAASRDSAVTALGRAMMEGQPDLPQRMQALARDRMPAHWPGVEYFVHGLDRTVWIALRRTESGTPVLVLDGDTGEPVARIELPRGERLRQASRTQAWVTRTDDDGVASVVRYRVVGMPGGR